MPPRTPRRQLLVFAELVSAAATAIGEVLDELVDDILALQRTARAFMPGLTTSAAPLASSANNSFAFSRASARRC